MQKVAESDRNYAGLASHDTFVLRREGDRGSLVVTQTSLLGSKQGSLSSANGIFRLICKKSTYVPLLQSRLRSCLEKANSLAGQCSSSKVVVKVL